MNIQSGTEGNTSSGFPYELHVGSATRSRRLHRNMAGLNALIAGVVTISAVTENLIQEVDPVWLVAKSAVVLGSSAIAICEAFQASSQSDLLAVYDHLTNNPLSLNDPGQHIDKTTQTE